MLFIPTLKYLKCLSIQCRMNKNIDDELSRWIVQLLIKEPFYAHFLGQVTRIISEDITDTAAVGIRNNAICLFINPKFFGKVKNMD